MTDLVSVIIPTFGRPDMLKKAILSALDQDYNNIEVVIVDDNEPNSTEREETERLISEFEDARIIYIKQNKNTGGALARNTGVQHSSGKYICFLDDDDSFHPNKISAQLAHIQKNKLDISFCHVLSVRHDNFKYGVTIYPIVIDLKDFVLRGNALNGMIMIKKDLFIKAGGFKQVPRFQDHILMFNLYLFQPRIGILEKELYFYNVHFGDRIGYSSKSRLAFETRHFYENQYLNLLSEKEQIILKIRQNRSLFRCDINSAEGIKKIKIGFKYIFSCKDGSSFFSNVIFFHRCLFSQYRIFRLTKHYIRILKF